MSDFYHIDKRAARKGHICRECRTDIQPGDEYYEQRHVTDGSWSTLRFCAGCQRLISRCCREHNRQEAMELIEYVFGYHLPDEIAEDDDLLGFAIRWGQHEDNRLADILKELRV